MSESPVKEAVVVEATDEVVSPAAARLVCVIDAASTPDTDSEFMDVNDEVPEIVVEEIELVPVQ